MTGGGHDVAELDLDEYLKRIAHKPIKRRGFLYASGLAAAGSVLAACTGGASSAPSAGASAAPSGGAVASPELESDLFTYNWSEYVNPDNIKEFEARTGVKYGEDIFSNNEELIAKLAAAGGNPGYDIACPTGEYVPGMIEAGYVEKLDISRIPNFQYINPTFKSTAWDPNNEYLVAKDYGTTGVMYRTKLVSEPLTSWREFFDLATGKYSEKVVVVDSMGDVFPFALKMLGYSVNDNDPAHLDEAGKVLLDLAPHVLALDSENYDDKLGTEEAVMALCWTGGLNDLQAVPETADAVYLNPSEGGLYWMDVWVVLKEPPHPNAAYAWLNFIHEPAIQAQETVHNYYATANDEAKKLVPQEILDNPAVFPPEAVISKLEGSLDHSGVTQRQDIWAEFKAKVGT
jgi:spermidine/putrescine transport system substrate-binding protein